MVYQPRHRSNGSHRPRNIEKKRHTLEKDTGNLLDKQARNHTSKGVKHELWNRRWHQRKIWVTTGRIQIKHTNEATQQGLEILTIHNIKLGLNKGLPTTFNAQYDCYADQQYHYNPLM